MNLPDRIPTATELLVLSLFYAKVKPRHEDVAKAAGLTRQGAGVVIHRCESVGWMERGELTEQGKKWVRRLAS